MFEKFNHQVTKNGRWTLESSGGIHLEKTFTKNSFYILEVNNPDTNMMAEISSQSNLGLSLYLIKTNKRALNELDQREIDSAVSPADCSAKYNSLFFDFGKTAGTFLVVPCNYNKEEGIYEIKFSTTKPVEVTEGNPRGFQIRKDYTLNMVNDPKYLSASSKREILM